jgi:hypothetical protein
MHGLNRWGWMLLIALAARPVAAEELSRNAALDSIVESDLRRHLNLLADDSLEGRAAGSRGGRAAGIYLVKHLQKLGVPGAGDEGSHFQSFGAGSRNVLGLIEGSDPELKDQVIVVSAHYDHVGYGNQQNSYGPIGHIHNGADDNASGTSGLMEVIEAVTRLPERPKRSILFAFWDGEEAGLLGSQHWVDHPTLPLERVVAMLNVDMIGRLRNERVEVYGTRTLRGARELVSRQNSGMDLALDFSWEMRADSDHWTFFNRGIPTLMLHTGLHDDYHRPSDDVERIEIDGLRRVTRLLFAIACGLADAPAQPRFRNASRRESPATKQLAERPLSPLPGRLGVQWDRQQAEAGQVRVTAVVPRSAAERAGLRTGDRILRVAGQDVLDGEQFRGLVLAATNPATFSVERAGHDQPLDIPVTLTGGPVRVGVSWRIDDAEPGAVILTRVVPGSPADRAGLRPGERVYRVADQPFASSDAFRRLITSLPGPLSMEVERAGRMRMATLDLPGNANESPDEAMAAVLEE